MQTYCRTFILALSMLIIGCEVQKKEPDELIANHGSAVNAFTVTLPASTTYIPGNILVFKLDFPFFMSVTGLPRLELTIGSTTRYANYVSGHGTKTLRFQYSVTISDDDPNGIDLEALDLNGGTLTFSTYLGSVNCNISSVVPTNLPGIKVDNGLMTSENSCDRLTPDKCRSFTQFEYIDSLGITPSTGLVALKVPELHGKVELLGDKIFIYSDESRSEVYAYGELIAYDLEPGSIHILEFEFPSHDDLTGTFVEENLLEVTLLSSEISTGEKNSVIERMELQFK